jgi:histidine ammonia-lyase
MPFKLGEDRLDCFELVKQSQSKDSLDFIISDKARKRLNFYRDVVNKALESGKTHYGINTGFGYLSDVRIESSKLEQLQINLVRSHACGVGDLTDEAIVRSLLFLRAHTFCLGHTGISEACVDLIAKLLQVDILPAVPSQGSVGACGDLAPLAHLALAMIGEGQVLYQGKLTSAADVFSSLGITPHTLLPKEGLSLINGTHYMTAIAADCVAKAHELVHAADVITALSLDASRGTLAAFDARIHAIRKHPGQEAVAGNVRELFSEVDPIVESHKDCDKVQDPYSFRCVPQVHGASRDALEYVTQVINRELNSVTDNPLCFDDGSIISGGNFHGEPVAMAMDFLAIAMSEIANISERRIEKLTNPNMSGLPAFLVKDSGLSSGFMIPHVVAAALVSENKVHSHPASVDSIPTSADKEDHVSMGPIAAIKARKVIHNTANVLAIELLGACQGIDLLSPLKPGPKLKKVYDAVRIMSPALDEDRSLHGDIEKVAAWLLNGGLSQL